MFYVHEQSMDVFVEVLKVVYSGPRYMKIKVLWWNYGYDGTNPWCLSHHPQTIKVDNKKWISDWRWFEPLKDKHPGRESKTFLRS